MYNDPMMSAMTAALDSRCKADILNRNAMAAFIP
jgi:hypothetical protein